METEKIKIKSVVEKMATHYGVKSSGKIISVKGEGDDDRTIKAMGNTYFLIDSDQDMLVTGCATRSIDHRGPNSNAVAKIKHQSDHVLNTKNVVGRITKLDEREVEGMFGLYFESFIPDTMKGNDDLENYKQGLYDNHSIGFRYKDLQLAVLNGTDAERKLWDEFYPKAINPEEADKRGFFYVVKEIELFEISVVSFGANKLTPYLGSKSQEGNEKIKKDLISRFDSMEEQLKSSPLSKEEKSKMKMDFLQMRQIITDLELDQSSKKPTPKKESGIEGTEQKDESKQLTINKLTNNF